ncbi:hypothetical protein ACQR1I_35520 [Bradyrhizobium sp. HKCCYLS2038]|uniref:hypothetical protein n=1 Tax=unclassified Bradyrhizobium TaxID=2631580 RepID=UPI003EBCD834
MTDQADSNSIAASAHAQVDLSVVTIGAIKKARALLLDIQTAGASIHLTNAVSAIKSAVQYLEIHFKEPEAKVEDAAFGS